MGININLSSLIPSQGIFINGESLGDHTGWSVSGTSDINGDGYPDILISAPYYSTLTGRAYLIYGNSSLANINLANITISQGISITGKQQTNGDDGTGAGWSVSGAGDVNGDGYLDILVGAPFDSIVYLIYGNIYLYNINLTSLNSSQGTKFTGDTCCYTESGWSVSGSGDVNGDGYNDILIGAVGISKAYLIYGKANLASINLGMIDSSQGISFFGETGSNTGYSVSGAGDINNDGYDDIIIGAPSNGGTVYLIYGNCSLTNINLVSLSSSQGISITGEDHVGDSVSGAGDVNGDGYLDIIIGAPSLYSPTAYIIYGNKSLSNINLASLNSSQGISIIGLYQSATGSSVSNAGDINNDGYDDVVIGAPSLYSPTAYIIYGNKSLSNINLVSLNSSQGISFLGEIGSYTGTSVSGAGDINNDGYDDILVGAPYAESTYAHSAPAGTAYLIYGSASGVVTLTPTLQPTILPSVAPSIKPSVIPSVDPTLTPTYTPTLIPTASPSITPSFATSSQPTTAHTSITNIPTLYPTKIPTTSPRLDPSALPSVSPTNFHISEVPTKLPTFMPTQAIEITSGGIYQGTESDENFVINSSSDVTIIGGGGSDMYTIEPNTDTLITVTDFNNNTDVINLKAFNIYNFDEVNITSGSIIITLENNQIMKLLQLSPDDISANNFIFSPSLAPTLAPTDIAIEPSDLNDGAIIAIAVGGSAALGLISYGFYAYTHNFWPFIGESLASAVEVV
ncbi:MAG: FG-GAP-like repeat-containing protein [Rickettsiales bacterium]